MGELKLNVITGLPRSGSTLLCNILNQNPKFWATSTSILPQMVATIINIWSGSLEFKAELDLDKEKTEDKLVRCLKTFCNEWHRRDDGRFIIFDKSRGWSNNVMALKKIYPDAKILVTVRDLRNVFASVEKQHRLNPLLDAAENPNMKTIWSRADIMFSPQGMIGSCVEGINDILRRKLSVNWVKYERLSEYPALVLKEIYEYLEEDYYEHDFTNIENTAIDPDAFYNYKYPHKGEGAIKATDPNEWKKFMSDEIAFAIMQRFQLFNQFFSYAPAQPMQQPMMNQQRPMQQPMMNQQRPMMNQQQPMMRQPTLQQPMMQQPMHESYKLGKTIENLEQKDQ